MKRRQFLRSAGVGLALPALESMGNASALQNPPPRFVGINIPLGFHSPNFFPENSGTNYELSPYLKLAEGLREKFTVISGTSHPGVDGGHSAAVSFLTAAPHPAARGFQNSLSLDRLIASKTGEQTRFASLSAGDKSLSYTANGTPVPSEKSPAKLFAKLFLDGSAQDVATQKRQLQNGLSILDTVLDEARSTQSKVSQLDREKLDQYFTAVRETERRLHKRNLWLETPKPQVEAAQPPQNAHSGDLIPWLRSHFDVFRLALQTDSSRVIAFSGADHGLVVPLPGVSMGYHGLTHHGKNPEMIRQLEIIDRETFKAWADFLKSLQNSPEGGATVLDHTQVLMGSNLGNASGHLTKNLPILIAGGGWKHGRYLAFDRKNNTPLANLFVSIMQKMGLEENEFASGKSTLTGLI